MKNENGFKISQYACAVLLIVSSIVMVAQALCQDKILQILMKKVGKMFG